MIEMTQGDMFAQDADIRVNTVNCVGVMGAGIALAFKQRYPNMFEEYRLACKRGEIRPGRLTEWRELGGDWVVNFPTKRDWREPSRYEDIDAGLDAFRAFLKPLGAVSVALPALGCGHGGLDWTRVSAMISEKLDGLDAQIQVYAPADSRKAGRKPPAEVAHGDTLAAEEFGFGRMSLAGRQLFTKGAASAVSAQSWLAVFASRNPGEREVSALTSIAAALSQQEPRIVPALVHQGKASEEIASLFAAAGLNVVLLAPMGALTKKSLAGLASERIAVATLGTPHEKWSRSLMGQAMNLLRERCTAVLVADPAPIWLIERPDKWKTKAISFVAYNKTTENVNAELHALGAQPIKRRAADGLPNVAPLLRSTINPAGDDTTCASPLSEQADLLLDLAELDVETRRDVFALLNTTDPTRWSMQITFKDDAMASALEERIDRLRQSTRVERAGADWSEQTAPILGTPEPLSALNETALSLMQGVDLTEQSGSGRQAATQVVSGSTQGSHAGDAAGDPPPAKAVRKTRQQAQTPVRSAARRRMTS